MNQQPTVILLKFTDYLNNLDSLAFLRLSHSFWLSHRTPAGRYRIKPNVVSFDYDEEYSFGPNLSRLPRAFFSRPLKRIEEFSPVGNFLVDSINLASPEDFRQLSYHKTGQFLTNISLSCCLSEEFPQLPAGLATTGNKGFEGNSPYWKLKSLNLSALQGDENSYRNLFSHPLLHKENPIERLTLPHKFDCPIESGCLPSSLTEFNIGGKFSSSLALPAGLKILRFSPDSLFNLPLTLPDGLMELQLGKFYNQEILPGQLPATLKIIRFSERFNFHLEKGVFPPGLEEISFSAPVEQPFSAGLLPSSLKRFRCYLTDSFSSSLVLPDSLEMAEFSVNRRYFGPLPKFPNNLKILKFGRLFDISIESVDFFPPQLRVLHLDAYYYPLRKGIFPFTLEEIFIGQ